MGNYLTQVPPGDKLTPNNPRSHPIRGVPPLAVERFDAGITQWYYQGMGMVLKTVKLPAELAAALARKAAARGLTESELIREGIEHVTGEGAGLDMQAAIGADVGASRGPRDLSTNRKRLSGYGRTRAR